MTLPPFQYSRGGFITRPLRDTLAEEAGGQESAGVEEKKKKTYVSTSDSIQAGKKLVFSTNLLAHWIFEVGGHKTFDSVVFCGYKGAG